MKLADDKSHGTAEIEYFQFLVWQILCVATLQIIIWHRMKAEL